MKIASEKAKNRKFPQLLVLWPELFGIWPVIQGIQVCRHLLSLIQRDGKIARFWVKKSLFYPTERKIFGIWPQKNAPTLSESDFWGTFSRFGGQKSTAFSHKRGVFVPVLGKRNVFSTDSRHFCKSDGRQHCKNAIIGISVSKRRRNKAKQWHFPHNMDKMPEWQTFLWKIQPLYCIFPPKQRRMWINLRFKSGFLSIIAWFFSYF